MMMRDHLLLLGTSFSQQEARLAAYYASEFDENTHRRRICSMLAVPYELLYPERPKKPYWADDGCLIIPVLSPRSSMEIALLEAAELYDPVKWLLNGSRMEWPVWRPHARSR